MQNLRNQLIAGGTTLILAAIGTMMNSHPALGQAPGGPTVTINPGQLPLPVKGATTVSGTVAATQSGTWNVGLTGTPNVNVANPATAPCQPTTVSGLTISRTSAQRDHRRRRAIPNHRSQAFQGGLGRCRLSTASWLAQSEDLQRGIASCPKENTESTQHSDAELDHEILVVTLRDAGSIRSTGAFSTH